MKVLISIFSARPIFASASGFDIHEGRPPCAALRDLVLVGTFPPELHPVVDAELRCRDPALMLADSDLAGRIHGIIARSNISIAMRHCA